MNKHCSNLVVVVLAIVVLCSSSALLRAQNGPPEEVRRAQALVQAKDYDGAIKVLEEFLKTQVNQQRPGAWSVLGTAYRFKGDYDKALQAYAKAMTSPQFAPQSRYNSACVYALKNDKEAAFKALRQLRESGSFDMSLILSDEDLKSLRQERKAAVDTDRTAWWAAGHRH